MLQLPCPSLRAAGLISFHELMVPFRLPWSVSPGRHVLAVALTVIESVSAVNGPVGAGGAGPGGAGGRSQPTSRPWAATVWFLGLKFQCGHNI